jgi:hypothetical protein
LCIDAVNDSSLAGAENPQVTSFFISKRSQVVLVGGKLGQLVLSGSRRLA